MNKQYTVKEMAELHAVTQRTLRYYDEEGLLGAMRNEQNHRMYTDEDGIRLECILLYKQIGMSIKEIKQFLYEKGDKEIFLHLVEEKRKQLRMELTSDSEKLIQMETLQHAFVQGQIQLSDDIQKHLEFTRDHLKPLFSIWNVLHSITYAKILIYIFIFIDGLFLFSAIASTIQCLFHVF